MRANSRASLISVSNCRENKRRWRKKRASAVVTVTASLQELRDGLRAFKSKMREFNRRSATDNFPDLKVFKIEPEETVLVEAMTLLINTAEQVESGESFELFDQGSVWMTMPWIGPTDVDR